jgi:oligopeptide/dipeptide ABC transporter ATP-binding protein
MNNYTPLVQSRDLVFTYHAGGSLFRRAKEPLRAVNGVSLEICSGETLALVGESGCGKTTMGRLLLRLIEPSRGQVFFDGRDLSLLSGSELGSLRKGMQMIFQDPYSSLNPRFTVFRTLAEPLRLHEKLSGRALKMKIPSLLETVGLSPEHAGRYPHEFSGGQRQRIAIARAISVNPRFVVADEPVSSLDISIQGQIIKLLQELKKNLRMSMLFISHDLAAVGMISDRVAVMYRGRLVELAPKDDFYSHPLHPYSRLLLDSILDPLPGKTGWSRQKPKKQETGAMDKGCAFAGRCGCAQERCFKQSPGLVEAAPGHWVACFQPVGLEKK